MSLSIKFVKRLNVVYTKMANERDTSPCAILILSSSSGSTFQVANAKPERERECVKVKTVLVCYL